MERRPTLKIELLEQNLFVETKLSLTHDCINLIEKVQIEKRICYNIITWKNDFSDQGIKRTFDWVHSLEKETRENVKTTNDKLLQFRNQFFCILNNKVFILNCLSGFKQELYPNIAKNDSMDKMSSSVKKYPAQIFSVDLQLNKFVIRVDTTFMIKNISDFSTVSSIYLSNNKQWDTDRLSVVLKNNCLFGKIIFFF